MEVVSEGSLESISRPSSSGKRSCSRSSIRSSSLPVQGSLDILPSEEPLNVIDFELQENISINDSDSSVEKEQYLSSSQEIKPLDEECHTKINVESGKDSSISANETTFDDKNHDFEKTDPKIQKGLEKIKKLDAVLAEKIKKEKEVKKQRLHQERLWREELDHLEQERDLEELGKQVDLGPAHILALGAADNTDEGVCEGDSEEDVVVTPLFATQPTIEDNHHKRREVDRNIKQQYYSNNEAKEDDGNKVNEEANEENEKRKNKKNNKTRRKDYIKRNIQLAADANNTIAMTDEEKKRLEELLSDMGNLMNDGSENELASLSFLGEGYRPTAEEVQQLNDIDFKLQSLLPAEEFDVLCTSSLSSEHIIPEVHTPRSDALNGILNEESHSTFGEIVLQETKDMREMKERLLAIENELERFRNLDYDQGILSQSLLRQLLDDSSRTTSQSTSIPDRVSSVVTSVSGDFDDRVIISACVQIMGDFVLLPRECNTRRIKIANDKDKVLLEIFERVAGEDGVIDAFELQDLLHKCFHQEIGDYVFNLETCRSLVTLFDQDQSGFIEFDEFLGLWNEIKISYKIFQRYDKDHSKDMNKNELNDALKQLGIFINRSTLEYLLQRFANKKGFINLDDFLQIVAKIKSLTRSFDKQLLRSGQIGENTQAKFTLDLFIVTSVNA